MLEVGCGDGQLAATLVRRGHEVVALDVKLPEQRPEGPRYVECDFIAYEEPEKFDAVLFSRSLHHIHPLNVAIDRAAALLVPRGALVVDDFDVDAATKGTARWFYQQLQGHHHHREFDPDAPPEPEPEPVENPLEEWRKRHEHEPPLHNARAMDEAIRARFHVSMYGVSQYLYSYFPPERQQSMHVHEIQAILRRTIVPMARRWIAHLE